jgi:glycosyltransferase involved in cell wall biosynthesis
MSNSPLKPIRILFVCWGYSIHARRRVQLFIDDPQFEVAVASTYNYGFSGATFYPLGDADCVQGIPSKQVERPLLSRLSPETIDRLVRLRNLLFLPAELVRSWRDWTILRRAAEEFRPDIVFLQTLMYPSYLAYLLPRRMPIMVTFWNGDVTHFARWTGLEMLAKKWLVKYGIRRAQWITCNSQTAFDASLQLGAEAAKMSLIRYPATDLELFARRDGETARRRLSVDASYVVLCPRGLGRFFNSDVIIEAIPAVVARFPGTLFLFVSGVGGAAEWARHQARARELGVEGNIRWDGQIPWEDMPWYYSAADAMVSILANDSCPNCMLEAMAAELPIVMSDTRQNREWIEDGANGFLIEPQDPEQVADSLTRILENGGGLADSFRRVSLERVRQDGNARVNVPKIKDLVLRVAGRQPAPELVATAPEASSSS